MRDDPILEARFRRVFDAYHDRVYSYCRRRCDAETAREATSEIFLTAWRRFADMPDGDRMLPWLYGVARRVLANEFRRQKRYRNLVDRVRPLGRPAYPDVETVVVRRAEYQAVISAVARLWVVDYDTMTFVEVQDPESLRLGGCLPLEPRPAS